jgi:hypothetical protein
MEDIKNLLKCEICQETFSGTPILLSCCNATVCCTHVEPASNAKKRKTYECELCLVSHDMGNNKKFAPNKTIESLIKLELDKFSFGEKHKIANTECESLSLSLRKLQDSAKDPKNHIFGYISKIKRKVDLRREEVKLKIDKLSNDMITELDTFQEECYDNLNNVKMKESLKTCEQLVKDSQDALDKWNQSLRRLVIDEPKWEEIREEAKKLDIKLRDAKREFEESLVINQEWHHQFDSLKVDDLFRNELVKFEKKHSIDFEIKDFCKIYNQPKEKNFVDVSRKYSYEPSTTWSVQGGCRKHLDDYDFGIILKSSSSIKQQLYSKVQFTILNVKDSRNDFKTADKFWNKIGFYVKIKDIIKCGLYDSINDKVSGRVEFYYKLMK